jgi:hypothetical protein
VVFAARRRALAPEEDGGGAAPNEGCAPKDAAATDWVIGGAAYAAAAGAATGAPPKLKAGIAGAAMTGAVVATGADGAVLPPNENVEFGGAAAGVGVSANLKPPLGAGVEPAAGVGASGFSATGVVCPKENVDLEESVVGGALGVAAVGLSWPAGVTKESGTVVPNAKLMLLLAVAEVVGVGVWTVTNGAVAVVLVADGSGVVVLIRFRLSSVMIRSSRSSRWRLVRMEWDNPSCFRCPIAPKAIRPPLRCLFLASTTWPSVVSPSNRRFRT